MAGSSSSLMLEPPSLEDFKLRGVLGAGKFAEVLLAEKTTGSDKGQYYALKRFTFRKELEKTAALQERNALVRISQNLRREVGRKKKAVNNGCFIVRLCYAFQPSPHEACLVTNLGCGTDLHDLVKQFPNGALTEEVSRFYLAEVLCALDFLHDKCRVVHTDLKLENVLIDDEGHLLLCDFNLAYHLPSADDRIVARDGTLATMAPEVAAYEGYSFPADIWSYGMIAVQLVTGASTEPPACLTWKEKYEYVARGAVPRQVAGFGGGFRAFVGAILKKDPVKRPTAAATKKLAFFRKLNWAAVQERRLAPPCQPFGNLPGARRDIGLKSEVQLIDEMFDDFDYVDPV